MRRTLLVALLTWAPLAIAGDRAARLFDQAVTKVSLPSAREAEAKACLDNARVELTDAFNDHRSDEVLAGEVDFQISRCLDSDAAVAAASPPAAADGPPAPVETAVSPSGAATDAEATAEPAETPAVAEASDAIVAEDPTVAREFLSWYLCEVCQRIVDKGVSMRKAARKKAKKVDRAALQSAEKQIAAGKQCGKFAVGEFRKANVKPFACSAPAIASVVRCLSADGSSEDPRCRAFQARTASVPAADAYLK